MPNNQITLYSRTGCHLCDEAHRTVTALMGKSDILTVVDIDETPTLRDRFSVRVPVVEVNGVEVAQYVVEADTFRFALRGGE